MTKCTKNSTNLSTLRQICRNVTIMKFIDFQGREVSLSDEVWTHIKVSHPEISEADISDTLIDPIEVRQSSQSANVELYYAIKIKEPKLRYKNVIVKSTQAGYFISSAMTTSSMKKGLTVFKRNEEE